MFTDTNVMGTNYDEWIKEEDIITLIQNSVDLRIYPFSTLSLKGQNGDDGYEMYALESGGEWFELTQNPAQMYENLMKIIEDNACE